MPFCLKDRDVSSDMSNVGSALIVPCRFCPAASLAVREKRPYIELLRTFLRTAAYVTYVEECKSQLERVGIRTEVFDSRLPHQFVVCMWTARRRQALRRRAASYDAVMVLGCDAAVKTAQDCLQGTDCRVISGMEVDGIMNVMPSIRFPGTISLELTSVTRVVDQGTEKAAQEVLADAA